MKKVIFAVTLLLLAFLPQAYASITASPSSWSVSYTIGETGPTKQFTYANNENQSTTVTLTKSGETNEWITLNESSFNVPPLGNKQITASLTIPSTASPGIYVNYVSYSDQSIPIIITVSKSADFVQCRLSPLVTDFITSVKSGTTPFTKKFSVTVSKYCSEPVDIKTPIIVGVTETSEGAKPIALSGALSLGLKDPGEEAEFDVQFDVNGLQPGTYSPTVIIPGYYKGEKIETAIDFAVTVTGQLSPTSSKNIGSPTYEIPDQVRRGEEFEIRVEDLDPNLQPEIFFNADLVGVTVERDEDVWVWKGYLNKTGTTEIRIASFYNGGQIGGVRTQEVIVVEDYDDLAAASGKNMTFDFFPKIQDIKDGDNVSVLVRDGIGNILEGAIIYVNGKRISDHSFRFDASQQYQLSATHPNYPTLDKVLDIERNGLNIIISPDNPEQGDSALITVTDAVVGGVVQNITFFVDGNKIQGNTFLAGAIGTHTIKAVGNGYKDTTKSVNVSARTELLDAPPEISRGKNVSIHLSQPTTWSVRWTSADEEKPESKLVSSGNTDTIVFLPEDRGTYQVYIKGGTLAQTYSVEGIGWSWWYLLIIGVVAVALLAVFVLARNGGGRSRGGRTSYGFPQGGGGPVTPV